MRCFPPLVPRLCIISATSLSIAIVISSYSCSFSHSHSCSSFCVDARLHFPRANCQVSCIALSMNKTSSQFEGLLSRHFETLLTDVPTFAAAYAGLPSGEGKLGRLTPDFHKKREKERQL